MALSLVNSFNDLELNDLDDLEHVDLEHNLNFFSILSILFPALNQLLTLCLNENTFSSISVNHNSCVVIT